MRRSLFAAAVAAIVMCLSADRAAAQFVYSVGYPAVYAPVVYPTVPVVGARALTYDAPVYYSRAVAPTYYTRTVEIDRPVYTTRYVEVDPVVTYSSRAVVRAAPAVVPVAPVVVAPAPVVVRSRGLSRVWW